MECITVHEVWANGNGGNQGGASEILGTRGQAIADSLGWAGQVKGEAGRVRKEVGPKEWQKGVNEK